MLPLSLTRAPAALQRRTNPVPAARRGWLRPANTTTRSMRESQAAVIWGGAAAVVGILIALGHVWLRLQVVEVGYRLSTTRQVVLRLESEGQELLLAASRLDAPSRLEALARGRLGMMSPGKGQELVLR